MRILIADDAASIRFALEKMLTRWGHDVVSAEDGEQAWEILQREDIRCVISDWMMPKMNGPELCARIRAHEFDHYIYVILLTSRDAKGDLLEGMKAGADDFVVKPFNRAELNVRIRAGERIVALEQELEARNLRLNQTVEELEVAYGHVRADLEAASKVQRDLMPSKATRFGPVLFEHVFLPSAYVSGDSFGYFPLDENHLAFYSLDVSGHGVPSALLSVAIHEVLKPDLVLKSDDDPTKAQCPARDPAEVVSDLNVRFQAGEESNLYFTTIFGLLDLSSGELKFCQAGHPNPLRITVSGESIEFGEGGFPVGILPEAEYETQTIRLLPGETFVLYSDGVTDCVDEQGVLFGMENFQAALARTEGSELSSSIEMIQQRLVRWVGAQPLSDDVSVLALEFNPVAAEAAA
ncbi:MAG: SpoIIE family protein phosphatase [Gammaproteobacteria bacterium]|nr:SpoIIE family protein phosphatase [Gammaproteobacteria bacterium]